MKMADSSFAPTLFCRPPGLEPIVFAISPGEKRKQVSELILEGGGILMDIKTTDTDGGRISLADPKMLIMSDYRQDLYSIQYIYDCVEKNRLLKNLREYRLNQRPRFVDHDPYDVLVGKVKWKDIQRREEEVVVESDDSISFAQKYINPDLPKKTYKKTGKRPYSRLEQHEILGYIAKRKLYNLFGGRTIWEMMEKDGVCGGRTWQSMKENFRRQIMPSIGYYNLSAKRESLFRKAWAGEQVNDFSDTEETDREEPNAESSAETNESETEVQRGKEAAKTSKSVGEGIGESEEESNKVRADKAKKRGPHRLFTNKPTTSAWTPQPSSSPDETSTPRKGGESSLQDKSPRCSPRKQSSTNSNGVSPTRKARESSLQDKSQRCSPRKQPSTSSNGASPTKKAREEDKNVRASPRKNGSLKSMATLTVTPIESDDDEDSDQSSVIFPRATVRENSAKTKPAIRIKPPLTKRKRPKAKPDVSVDSSFKGCLYTEDEDLALANYIRENGFYSEHRGRAMWEEAVRRNVVPYRSWQSLKNRFIKQVLPTFGQSYFDTDSEAEGPASPPKKKKGTKFIRGGYSREEDQAILDYIVKNKRFGETRGRAFWEVMEERQICPGRTWQSLKERYLKRIVKNLDNLDVDESVKHLCK